jgi:hypothetical protein
VSETVLDVLVGLLKEAFAFNENVHEPPLALLFPDEAGQWSSIRGPLRERLPFLTLGDYEPAVGGGPAYWVRCVVAGEIDAGLPKGRPVIYMPGVARGDLRAIEGCPARLAPIAELQYRSQWFSHPNGKDWTVRSLLSNSEKGLGLQIAEDTETASMLLHALDKLVDLPIDGLRSRFLDTDFFCDLINPDPINSLLGWLDDPASLRNRLDDSQWMAFVQECRSKYGLNPDSDGVITGAEKLGARAGVWANVWERYAATPELYPGIKERLRVAKPLVLSIEQSESWPQDNEAGEDQLRRLLLDFEVLTPGGARAEAKRLDAEHAWRRRTVWARLGLAPLAFALEQLATLSEITSSDLAGDDVPTLQRDYTERGWQADDALLRALATTTEESERAAVAKAATAIYRSWLEAGASGLQAAIGPMTNADTYQPSGAIEPKPGAVTVFVDGLRLDVAHRVRERLAATGLEATIETALAALPTVTQTAKPALAPVASGSLSPGPELHPVNSATGTKATAQVLRSLMIENDVQVLGATETGDPLGSAWTEVGELDHRGHDVGIRLVDYLDEYVGWIVSRVRELLGAGWQSVVIVTDHGWILLPGRMEKVDLPVATTELKKGRCARLKEGADVSVPTVPWHWDQNVQIALAPGATCFEANKEYEHGGVSPQECFVPKLTVTARVASAATTGPEITKVTWLGLLCRAEFERLGSGLVVDLRAMPADPRTSIAEGPKETAGEGKVSLLVPDEEHEGQKAFLVVVDRDGQLLVQREVIVGRNR